MVKKLDKQEGALSCEYSFVKSDKPNIIVETVKKCENDDSIIVRFYDAYNMFSNVNLTFGANIKKAFLCDMLENEQNELELSDNTINLDVKNFEIVTVKIVV